MLWGGPRKKEKKKKEKLTRKPVFNLAFLGVCMVFFFFFFFCLFRAIPMTYGGSQARG